ncbi:MAG: hypothetical protein ACR2P5_04305 [Gammaproteobacteria bacterium]
MSEVLVPTLDLLAFYASNKGPEVQANAGAPGGVGAEIQIAVPESELWYIHNVHGRIQYGAAGSQIYTLALLHKNLPIVGGGLSETCLAQNELRAGQNSGGKAYVTYASPQPYFAPAGSIFSLEVADATGGFTGVTFQVEVLFTQVSSFPGATSPSV